MTTRPSGRTKRSSRLTFRRRLLLIGLLLRGPLAAAKLIAAVQRELGEEDYPDAAESALKHDFDALRVWLPHSLLEVVPAGAALIHSAIHYRLDW